MDRWCHYCGKTISEKDYVLKKGVKIGRDRYAHTDCIDNHGKEIEMNEHEEARKIELHDTRQILEHETYLEELNLLVTELQARIVGPQQLHVVMAAEDALGNETVMSLAYHGSFTVWWVDWSPDLEAYEEGDAEDQDNRILDDMIGEPLGIPVLPDLLDTLASDDFGPGEDDDDLDGGI